ncbi:MAG: DUF3619 family protein [Massilia sp.]
MNTDDINFAYKVRHALNEKLDDLPASTTDRLASARQLALSRKKADAPVRRATRKGAGLLGGLMAQFTLVRMGVAIPLLAMVIGLAAVYHVEEQEHIAELAALDAAVLSDELPLTAYLDHGFNAYLEQREQRGQ